MIPVLYRKDEIDFTSNGLGRLVDCITGSATEEVNGSYEIEFEYPTDGNLFDYMIEHGGVVYTIHDDRKDLQAFDIYSHTTPLDGFVTFRARHISYRLNPIMVKPFTAVSCADAMQGIKANSATRNPFTFWTDKNVGTGFELDHPESARALLGGKEGSILDVYGKGEYEFDMFNVKLYLNRGRKTDVTIRYGKNLKELNREYDESDTFSAIAPYWKNDEEVVYLPEIVVVSDSVPVEDMPWTDENGEYIHGTNGEPIYFRYARIEPVAMDLSASFDEKPTVEQLREKARQYLANNKPWEPHENITIDFEALWQTTEYESVAALERLALCDSASIYYPEIGIIVENKKIIKTQYDFLNERYLQMEFGALQSSLAETITEAVQSDINDLRAAVAQSASSYDLERAIEEATKAITGGLGGHLVIKMNANEEPEELLIMDTDNIATAVNVWRWNLNGLGHSHNGYNGPFSDVALTMDGKINASMITTGILNAALIQTGTMAADRIKGGTLLLGGSNNTNGSWVVQDANSTEVARGDKDGVTSKALTATKYVYINAGAGSYFKMPISATKPDTEYFLITNEGQYPFLIYARSQNPDYPNGVTSYGIDVSTPYSYSGFFVGDADGETKTRMRASGFIVENSNARIYAVASRGIGAELRTEDFDSVLFTLDLDGDFFCKGTKSREVDAGEFGERLLYCYETATPTFGDIGSGTIGEDGTCYVWIEPIFAETISNAEYLVTLQEYGDGRCWVKERNSGYFVVEGTPHLEFGWEIKAKQKGYDQIRIGAPKQTEEAKMDYGALASDYVSTLQKGRIEL